MMMPVQRGDGVTSVRPGVLPQRHGGMTRGGQKGWIGEAGERIRGAGSAGNIVSGAFQKEWEVSDSIDHPTYRYTMKENKGMRWEDLFFCFFLLPSLLLEAALPITAQQPLRRAWLLFGHEKG